MEDWDYMSMSGRSGWVYGRRKSDNRNASISASQSCCGAKNYWRVGIQPVTGRWGVC